MWPHRIDSAGGSSRRKTFISGARLSWTRRPGRPRSCPEALLGDKGYDSNPNREGLRKHPIRPLMFGVPLREITGVLQGDQVATKQLTLSTVSAYRRR